MKIVTLIITLILVIPSASAGWVFSEVFYNPLGSDNNKEWVELVGPVIPEDSRFVEDGGLHGLHLIQGDCLDDCVIVIADDASKLADNMTNISRSLLYDSSWSSLKNSGERISLMIDGVIVAETEYTPIGTAGQSVNFDGETWFASTPTPGRSPFFNRDSQQNEETDEEVGDGEVPEFSSILSFGIILSVLITYSRIEKKRIRRGKR